jgi:hypothetical protein
VTTAAQVSGMVQPVVDRNSDLVLVKRWLFVRPVHHFARAILIDRTAYADHFDPQWLIHHLFEYRDSLPLTWGEFLANERSSRRGVWRTSDSDVELALQEAIELQALPALRRISTFDDFLAHVAQHTFKHQLYEWPTARIVLDVALGELDHARTICEQHAECWSSGKIASDEDGRATYARLGELCRRLMADDRAGLIRLLHEWEAATVKNLKIEHIWEPTPFPIELRS